MAIFFLSLWGGEGGNFLGEKYLWQACLIFLVFFLAIFEEEKKEKKNRKIYIYIYGQTFRWLTTKKILYLKDIIGIGNKPTKQG